MPTINPHLKVSLLACFARFTVVHLTVSTFSTTLLIKSCDGLSGASPCDFAFALCFSQPDTLRTGLEANLVVGEWHPIQAQTLIDENDSESSPSNPSISKRILFFSKIMLDLSSVGSVLRFIRTMDHTWRTLRAGNTKPTWRDGQRGSKKTVEPRTQIYSV